MFSVSYHVWLINFSKVYQQVVPAELFSVRPRELQAKLVELFWEFYPKDFELWLLQILYI